MRPHHPLPKPSLFKRTCYVLAIGVTLLAVTALFGCTEKPTAPVASLEGGPCWVVKHFPLASGELATMRLHYAVCPSDSLLAAKGWRREP